VEAVRQAGLLVKEQTKQSLEYKYRKRKKGTETV
jgi:hypothetical protein